jgi:hypothetical protein
MSYFCNICNYQANTSSNFNNHKKTQKHLQLVQSSEGKCSTDIQNEPVSLRLALVSPKLAEVSLPKLTPKLQCSICQQIFKHKSSLSRHKKVCIFDEKSEEKVNESPDLKTELLTKSFKIELLEKEKEMYQKMEKEKSELLTNFMANANVLLNKATDNTKITAQAMQTVSVSALKYANEKFKDAPALLSLDNFNINNLDFNNVEDKEQLTETLIYCAKQKSLDKLLGDHIVKCYKKENPEEQSFHTTDCSRLNYIVRDLIENALFWNVDKNGLKICKEIVKPLIKKCIDILLEHQKALLKEMGNGNYHKQKEVELIIDVIMSIDSGLLETDINKYIAPFFNLSKSIQ